LGKGKEEKWKDGIKECWKDGKDSNAVNLRDYFYSMSFPNAFIGNLSHKADSV